ncbi:uncharacterized protein LOC6574393 isoform X3 [Drosophila mojavensis]|uniref:uncharacterized protein LOC6574393 isoform X3 n=1 Tax=Drosophila mojavensis TaxID=7230 RepID=UPI001CD044E2|nr:uncharacterized protein LOC6574393 isoform X3 [Drosophila mojavensis]
MPKVSETTLRELQDILDADDPDENKFKDFLKKKTAPKPRNSPQYALGGYDVSFDIDVDLIKLPEKQQQQQKQQQENQQETQLQGSQNVANNRPLRDTFNNSISANVPRLVIESQPKLESLKSPTDENRDIGRPLSAQPAQLNCSPVKQTGGAVRDCNTSCHLAVSKFSHVSRLRQYLQEDLYTVINETQKNSGSFAFLPKVSSTPALEKPAKVQLPQSTQSAAAATTPKSALNHADFEGSFEESLTHSPRRGARARPASRGTEQPPSSKNDSHHPTDGDHRGTFVIEKPILDDDLDSRSPTNKDTNMGQRVTKASTPPLTGCPPSISSRQPYVRLRRSLPYMDLSRAPQHVALGSDRIVSGTQSPSNKTPTRASDSQPMETESEHIVPETQAQENIQHVVGAVGSVTPPLAVSCGIQTSCMPENVDAACGSRALEENDVGVEKSASPLDLAPGVGNTTRRSRRQKQEESQERTTQLLDLHRTRRSDSPELRVKRTNQPPLNKPVLQAINGEDFAEELARMTNYEILDLRKRNSLGRIHHQQVFTKEQQLALEQSIQMEMLRRNLSGRGDGLPSKPDVTRTEKLPTDSLPLPRLSRSRRRGIPISTELQNYLELPTTIKKRLNENKKCETKRSLYTKGDSDNEDDRSQQHGEITDSIKIAPAPPPNLGNGEDVEDIPIVPPPPLSLRYSRNLRGSQLQPNDNAVAEQAENVAEEQSQSSCAMIIDDIQIVPPPPESLRYSRLVRRSSLKQLGEQGTELSEVSGIVKNASAVSPPPDSNRLLHKSSEDIIEVLSSEDTQQKQTDPLDHLQAVMGSDNIQLPTAQDSSSSYMEELRMQTPTPPSSAHHQMELDEQPSTSKAAREALMLSSSRQQKKAKPNSRQKKSTGDNSVFKKPTLPAPRASKRNLSLSRELQNLRITTGDQTLPPLNDESCSNDDTNGVRKSRRGQVPLRNTWVHSVSEPFKSTFFERAIIDTNRRKRKRKSKSDQTTRSITLNENTSTSRGHTRPLKRMRQAEQDFGESGISPLPEITEEEEQQETAHESPKLNVIENEIARKRSRRRTLKSDSDNERQAAAEVEPAVQAEALQLPEQMESGMERELNTRRRSQRRVLKSGSDNERQAAGKVEPALQAEALQLPEQMESGVELVSEPPPPTPRLDTSQTQLLQMAEFLRGVEMSQEADVVAQNALDDSITRFTSVSDLKFMNLDGIEYSFYKTEESWGMGYMRFQPLQARGMKRNKTNTLRFLSLFGEFVVEVQRDSDNIQTYVLKSGDFIEIKMGSRFNIINKLNEVSLLIVNPSCT